MSSTYSDPIRWSNAVAVAPVTPFVDDDSYRLVLITRVDEDTTMLLVVIIEEDDSEVDSIEDEEDDEICACAVERSK